MSDLERIQQFHDWLNDKYELQNELKESHNFNQRLIVGHEDAWYWIYYMFKDGKLVEHWISE